VRGVWETASRDGWLQKWQRIFRRNSGMVEGVLCVVCEHARHRLQCFGVSPRRQNATARVCLALLGSPRNLANLEASDASSLLTTPASIANAAVRSRNLASMGR
jgi:hypothetical protein